MFNKFKVGDKVMSGVDVNGDLTEKISYDQYNENTVIGEVKEVLLKNRVKVLWEDQSFNLKSFNQKTGKVERYDPIEVDVDSIFSLKEGEKKVKELEVAFSKIEKEISEKLRIAGELVSQANELASTIGANLNQIDSCYDLMSALRDGGWRTSSMNC